MDNASYVALSQQFALRNQMDIIANNIANMSTPGYQGETPMFVEYLLNEETMEHEISFVQDHGIVRNTQPGEIVGTGNKLDVALNGEGYFAVETANGIFYTRNGSMRLDDEGKLVTSTGATVLGEGDVPFFFAPDETDITILRDGSVRTENGSIGRLRVVGFANPQNMSKIGDGLLTTEDVPQAATGVEVVQGMLELSNVKGVLEITRMIDVSRAYQSAQKVIESEEKRQQEALDTLGQPV